MKVNLVKSRVLEGRMPEKKLEGKQELLGYRVDGPGGEQPVCWDRKEHNIQWVLEQKQGHYDQD